MTQKVYGNLLLFALFGATLWFFGNLYEGIVMTPNLLTDSVAKVRHWQAFFTITNPVVFYIPLTPIAAIVLFVLYFKTPTETTVLKNHLKYASLFLTGAIAVGVFIITQINFKLFFGNVDQFASDIFRLSVLWNVLNMVRVILLAFAIYHLFNAYILVKTNK